MLRPQMEPDEQAFRFGSFSLNVGGRALSHGADAVPLTPKELDVLMVLVLLRGAVVSKDDLIVHAWAGEPITDSALFQTVYRLRRTLAQYDPHAEYVATVPGRGYQFVARVRTADPAAHALDVGGEAFRYYSRGMFEFQQRTRRSLASSIALFRRALRLDPGFAPAYAGLAHAHLCAGIALFTDYRYSYDHALRACRAALALDPNYGDAHAILSEVHVFFEADIENAQRAARRALSLAPNSPRVQTAAFWAFLTANDVPRALGFVRDALLADPSSNHFTTLLGVALYYARRFEEAHEQLVNAHLFRPADSMALFYDACVLCFLGDYAAAHKRFEQMEPADRAPRVLAIRAWIASRRNEPHRAMELIEQIASGTPVDDVALALALTAVNSVDRAAEHARRARASKQTSCYLIPIDPFFDPLREFMGC